MSMRFPSSDVKQYRHTINFGVSNAIQRQQCFTTAVGTRSIVALEDEHDFYKVFGQKIGRRRSFLKMTQAQVGARLSPPMTRASIANIEKGNQRVLAHTVVQLAAVLGFESPADLLASPRGGTLQQELKQKLSLPEGALATLLRQIDPGPGIPHGKRIERTKRKASR